MREAEEQLTRPAARKAAAPSGDVKRMEQALSDQDAAQVTSLHNELEEPVVYHVLIPVEDAAARVEAAMGTLAAG